MSEARKLSEVFDRCGAVGGVGGCGCGVGAKEIGFVVGEDHGEVSSVPWAELNALRQSCSVTAPLIARVLMSRRFAKVGPSVVCRVLVNVVNLLGIGAGHPLPNDPRGDELAVIQSYFEPYALRWRRKGAGWSSRELGIPAPKPYIILKMIGWPYLPCKYACVRAVVKAFVEVRLRRDWFNGHGAIFDVEAPVVQ